MPKHWLTFSLVFIHSNFSLLNLFVILSFHTAPLALHVHILLLVDVRLGISFSLQARTSLDVVLQVFESRFCVVHPGQSLDLLLLFLISSGLVKFVLTILEH